MQRRLPNQKKPLTRANPSEEILLIEPALSAFPNGIRIADLEIELRRALTPEVALAATAA
jgi:hypothetical protein